MSQFKSYDYSQNANLVFVPKVRAKMNEPTGEVETLRGKINPSEMGARAVRSRPTELLEKMNKRKKSVKEEAEEEDNTFDLLAKNRKNKKKKGASIVDAASGSSASYVPKTKETRLVYEKLLTFVKHVLGTQPNDILVGAADEVLATLKDENMKDIDKKKNVEQVLSSSNKNIVWLCP